METAGPNWDNFSRTEVRNEGRRGIELTFNLFIIVWEYGVRIYEFKDLKICRREIAKNLFIKEKCNVCVY